MLRWFLLPLAATACKNEDGAPVAWWVTMKAPRGTAYLYADSTSPVLAISPHSMNDTDAGALAHTVRQLWSAGTAYTLWNDEPPADPTYNFSYGHTKGILTDGFWLIHSIPEFPAGPSMVSTYHALGHNAWDYGQSAACVTIADITTLNTVGSLLQYYHPHIYDVGATPSVSSTVRTMNAGTIRTDPVCTVGNLTLADGTMAHMYAKTPAWNADLWSACVGPTEGVDLWVESWLRGSEVGPVCGGATWTTDVEEVDYGGGYTWSEYNDHSKWAVDPAGSLFCIGGINRMTTQYQRAGGALCWHSPLATAFANAVTAAQC